jgi:hypothetical protein
VAAYFSIERSPVPVRLFRERGLRIREEIIEKAFTSSASGASGVIRFSPAYVTGFSR